MSFVEAFDRAAASVTDDRAEHYGHPYEHYLKVSIIKSVLSECEDGAVRHALEMIAVKMCRLIHQPDHLDSIIDIAGYARTIAMVNDRRGQAADGT